MGGGAGRERGTAAGTGAASTFCQWQLRAKIFLIGSDPIGRDLPLGRCQVEMPLAHFGMQTIFQRIFDVGVPGLREIGLRPEIFYRIGAAKLQADKMVNLVLSGLVLRNPISGVDLTLDADGDVADFFAVAGNADIFFRHRKYPPGRHHWVGTQGGILLERIREGGPRRV